MNVHVVVAPIDPDEGTYESILRWRDRPVLTTEFVCHDESRLNLLAVSCHLQSVGFMVSDLMSFFAKGATGDVPVRRV